MEKRLTRKELVEYIKEKMPKDYDEIERLAFIEKEVARHISFDEKYLWGDSKTQEKIYELAKREAQKPQEKVKRKLICITMAELFGYVATQFGYEIIYQKRGMGYEIKAGNNEIFRETSSKSQEHICPLVKLSNGKFIEVDIQNDLMRLQTKSKPKTFGRNRHGNKVENGVSIQILDGETVDRVFKKVYNLGTSEKFIDEYIMALAGKLIAEGKKPIEMLEIFMNDSRIQEQLGNTRCIEANKLYKVILRVCYDVTIEKQFFKGENQAILEECILSDNEGRKRYSFCIYAEDEEQKIFYIYSRKSRKMIRLTPEEIQQMTQSIMKVELKGRPTDIKKKMMNFVCDKKERNSDIQPESDTLTLEDIFWNEEGEELE